MSYALIAHTVSGQAFGGITATTPAIRTTGANLIVIACGWDGGTPMVPTDSKSNTWTPLNTYTLTQTNERLFYCLNPTTDANHTFGLTNGIDSTFPVLAVQAWSGVSSFDVQHGGTGGPSTQPVPAGPITASGSGALLISAEVSINNTAISVNSGFTITDSVANVGHGLGIAMSYLIQGPAVSVNPTWTGQGVSIQVAAVAAFTPLVSAPVTLTMGSGMGVTGGTISLPISIASTGGAVPTEIQLTVSHTSDVIITSAVLGAAALAAFKTLTRQGDICAVWGDINATAIADGQLVIITFQIAANPSTGSIPISITAASAADAGANILTVGTVPGIITVNSPVLTCPIHSPAVVGIPFSTTLLASGGVPPYTYSVT